MRDDRGARNEMGELGIGYADVRLRRIMLLYISVLKESLVAASKPSAYASVMEWVFCYI